MTTCKFIFTPTNKEQKNCHALATTSAFNLKLCHIINHIDLASFTLFRQGMIMITDSMVFFKPSLTKVCFKHTQNVFQDIPESTKLSKKRCKKKPKGDHRSKKKRGGGLARYDHDHRFNGFF